MLKNWESISQSLMEDLQNGVTYLRFETYAHTIRVAWWNMPEDGKDAIGTWFYTMSPDEWADWQTKILALRIRGELKATLEGF